MLVSKRCFILSAFGESFTILSVLSLTDALSLRGRLPSVMPVVSVSID